ncbi:Ca2+ binding protein, contains EF-hand motif (ISS) [Trypanosoma theileri]|uniref:Ca2+ binding protein, contains EF-hand motif (ISS) n=1 Tax=Trypanosoma theileri TaxID=67003 RepID=A0A1X0NK53_9TRYP|nr:Ca2+ binding protein, contains EF-hand motif (ISS) [Trypanosoma theileri]ORC85144.1 Ca2+ binding protein, contains EF-hand motif (ISS) [Trypanosoma theileri]
MRSLLRVLWRPARDPLRWNRRLHDSGEWCRRQFTCAVHRWYHFFSMTRIIFAFSAAWCVVATLGAGVALCRPLDTPDYLIPYYLRDVKTRFKHYATHRKCKGGPKYMTVDDFVRAVLASKNNEPLHPSVVEGLEQLFRELDADGNTYISFSEFSFLMLLLTAKLDDVRMLFTIVDKDRLGAINLQEFAGVLRGLGCDPAESEILTRGYKNGIVKRLFGENGEGRCTYKEIEETIENLNEEVWKAEFRQFDTDRNDKITAEQFGKLIANQMIGSHVPFYIVENIRKMRGSGDTMTLELWISFHRVMQHADAITESVELFTSSGLPLRKNDFNRAIKAAGLPPMENVELDLIMALFDRNGDGVLQFDELLSVMQQKLTYHYSNCNVREKKSLPIRLIECVGEALQ